MRSDVPFAVDCLKPFWTRILGEQIDFDSDLRQSDIITYNFLNGLKSLSSESEFKELVGKMCPTHFSNEECCPGCPYKFSYASLDGRDVELRAGSPLITWSNLTQFIECTRELRNCELSAENMIPLIQCGLEAVVPLEPLRLMGPDDLQLRVCGQQNIDIGFIKLHTIYQVGISHSDKHIEYFWNVVESLSQEDLRKLIKFACNQERIPFSCPCQVKLFNLLFNF
jgi:E3 ubiquitin-protein ligase HECTD4